MNKEKCLLEVRTNFDNDLNLKLNPLYDIEQSVHSSTVLELRSLFEAVGGFAFDEGVKFAKGRKHDG